jgi:phospholipid N-methyltransferase
MSSRNHALLFARNFLRHPKVLGSVVPSSPFLVDQILGHIGWETARVIVEYGPGVGTFTGAILDRMRPDAHLVAIELNHDFVEFLEAKFRDPRLHVCHGSALEVDTFLRRANAPRADAIVSGIPFSTISLDLRRKILGKSAEVLAPGGRMLVYQFSRAVLPHLREHFRDVREDFVPLNILPARTYHCTQPIASGSVSSAAAL